VNLFKKYIIVIVLFSGAMSAKAQDASERGSNLMGYYYDRWHFGFTLGINRTNFIIQPSEHFERFDSLKMVESVPKLGFNLGIVSELKLHKYVTLRFVPNLSFAERNLQFYFEGYGPNHDTITKIKSIESTFLNFPIDIKLRSARIKNFGVYILAGGGYSLDLASKRNTQNSNDPNEQIVKLKRDDFSYEVGAGLEFYLKYFKFGIEGKYTIGTRNLLVKDGTFYSGTIDRLSSKIFLISLTFEG
jgi:hypothetical protein